MSQVTSMSLRRTVAAPFRSAGSETLTVSKFVVALSLDRNWFSPDQAKRVVDVAIGEGLLDRDDGELTITFDARDTTLPDGFSPDESILQQRTTFERVLDQLVDNGQNKQDAVAAINRRQSTLSITVETAAVLYAHEQGVEVSDLAEAALAEI